MLQTGLLKLIQKRPFKVRSLLIVRNPYRTLKTAFFQGIWTYSPFWRRSGPLKTSRRAQERICRSLERLLRNWVIRVFKWPSLDHVLDTASQGLEMYADKLCHCSSNFFAGAVIRRNTAKPGQCHKITVYQLIFILELILLSQCLSFFEIMHVLQWSQSLLHNRLGVNARQTEKT